MVRLANRSNLRWIVSTSVAPGSRQEGLDEGRHRGAESLLVIYSPHEMRAGELLLQARQACIVLPVGFGTAWLPLSGGRGSAQQEVAGFRRAVMKAEHLRFILQTDP
jgi:hypothetical protein